MQEKITFETRNNIKLSGVLHLPDTQEVAAYALFAHCFTCTKSINSAVHIADAMAQEGIGTLRFDFTGLGASKGDFSETSFTTNVDDLIDAATFLSEQYQAPQVLVGHSLGGTAILAAAKYIDSAVAVASVGSPADPEHILHLLSSGLDALESDGEATISLAGRPFKFKQAFVDDVKKYTIDYQNLKKALMVMHSPIDDTVSIAEANKIFSAAYHPKSFVTLNKADHLLTNSVDSKYVGQLLASWSRRYIVPKPESTTADNQGVIVSAKTAQGFLNKINANGHQIIADEPLAVGGTNLGPTPYDLLAAALGTCTAMTLNMYARRKKLDVTDIKVQVEHGRIHVEDCSECTGTEGKVDRFKRDITIEGSINVDQRKRMLEIADLCPVHKTLENKIIVETNLIE